MKNPLGGDGILPGSRELIDRQPASKFGLYRELVASNVPITPGWNSTNSPTSPFETPLLHTIHSLLDPACESQSDNHVKTLFTG